MEFVFELVPVVNTTRIAMGVKVETDRIVVGNSVGLWVIGIVRVDVGL